MEISTLLKKLKRTQREEPEQFLAIQIDAEFVKTAVWAVRNQLTEIVAVGSTAEWDGTSTELLVEAIDNSLALALEKLKTEEEPNNVIFGLPETWASTESVAAPRLSDLKTICEKLELKPLGFVVTTEAIAQYLRAKEGTPLTGILLRVSTSEVAVSVVTLGKIEGTHVAGRSGDLAADVKEGLTRFGERESLPSRIILYNGGEDLQDLTQQLMAYDWQSVFPFLHLPKIEAVNDTFSITAIAVAGGAEVAKSLGITISEPKPETIETVNNEETPTEPEEIETATQEESQEESAKPIPVEELPVPPHSTPKFHIKFSLPTITLDTIWGKFRQSRFTKWRPSFPSLPFPRGIGLTAIFVIVILTLLGAGTVAAARRLPRATARITFEGQQLSERLTMTVDPSIQSIDLSTNSLPADKVTISKSGERSKDTTGKKIIGDKAKGEVKIFNKTNATKKFAAGTIIIGPSGKQFVLDEDVTVASQSAQSTSGGMTITYGTATGKATAATFGSEYNLDANTEFTVATLSPSAFNAVNDAPFTGGTKNEIQAVSKKDKSDLRDALLTALKQDAAGEIESQAGGKKVFPETIIALPTEEKYSAQTGDEATTLKLSLTADVTALAVQDADYQNLLSSLLQDKLPDGFAISSGNINTSIENVKTSDDKVTFDAVVTASLVPRISESDIVDRIAGKRPIVAANAVKSLPHFKRIELSFSPVLPSIIQWIPSSKNHISVDIRTE